MKARRFKPPKPIIVVESDTTLRELIKEIIIEETPFWPIFLDSCKKAVELAQEQEPEVVVVDTDSTCMPEYLAKLLKLHTVLITSRPLYREGVVRKPIDPARLVEEINASIGDGRPNARQSY